MRALARRLRSNALHTAHRFGFHVIRAPGRGWGVEHYSERARPAEPRFVNIGAGAFYHPLWHNLDAPGEFYAPLCRRVDIRHDLASEEPLPFAHASVELFYCSHVIEHLSEDQVARLLRECARCLAPGGRLRIACPDMELQYRAYARGDDTFWRVPSPWGGAFEASELRFVEHFATGSRLSAADVRALFDQCSMEEFFEAILAAPRDCPGAEGHCNWFTAEKLLRMMQAAGFVAERSGYLQSADRRMRDPRLFDATCPELSLYVEATR